MSYGLSVYVQFVIFTLIAVSAIAVYNRKFSKPSLGELSGLKGWLYPMAFSFIFVLCYFYYSSYHLFHLTYLSDHSAKFFAASSPDYIQSLAIGIKTELAISVFMALSISYLSYSFIMKKKLFSKLYIPLHFLVLAFLVGVQISWMFNPNLNHFNLMSTAQIAIVAFGAFIWMPYMRTSKRVRVTFIN